MKLLLNVSSSASPPPDCNLDTMSDRSLLIREVAYEDCESVGELMQRNGLTGKCSSDRWIRLWQDNPAMPKDGSFPKGWVLENCGRIVGYLGNIPLCYHYNGKCILAAAARGLAVDSLFRSHSLRLTAAFFSQRNVGLLLNTTANEAVAAVFKMCKAQKITSPECDVALYWINKSRQFASSGLRKKYGVSGFLCAIGGALLGPAIYLEGRLRKRRPLGTGMGYDIEIIDPNSVGMEFDELWQHTLQDRPNCIIADRSAQSLRWHFGHGTTGGRGVKFVCARRAGKLVGYTVLTRENSEEIGLMRSRISDFIAQRDALDLIDALLLAAFQQASRDGSYMTEIIGFPAVIRERLVAGRAHSRLLPSWPFWQKLTSPVLCNANLTYESSWYASTFDGDASL